MLAGIPYFGDFNRKTALVVFYLRDCTPSGRPLVKSYFHGVCATPLSADTVGDVIRMRARDQPDRVVFRVPHVGQELTLGELNVKVNLFLLLMSVCR